jgi:Holliday junction resolvase-like predicted endonuclease
MAKRRRTVEAAKAYLREHPTKLCPRLDVIEVYLDRSIRMKPFKINHIPDAFSASGAVR